MGIAVYKPGQGYWTRVMSAIGWGLVALMGADWVQRQLTNVRIGEIQPVYIRAAAFILVMAVAGFVIYYYIGRNHKTVDFLIATEGEMKKVNWSTRREIVGMTWVVIGLTVLIAVYVAFFDYLIFSPFFQFIKVLEKTAT